MARRKKKPTQADPPPTPKEPAIPNPDSVVSETTITSPKGNRYRVIQTTEVDEYEEKPAPKKRKRKKQG
jgi:hypothetical protein